MPSLLQIHFNFPREMMGPALTEAALPLAESITREPGFISKIWTENPGTGEAGGIYLFEDEENALAYATMHEQRVLAMGASGVQYKLFEVNEPLSRITKGIL
ncbi:monooxygenase [Aeromonas lusitana]|uniref:Monooxygenase n=1 Tax=Aeromonas lusitana TaxID=931529 RepID=A0A2M8HD91_9GAMM|nr:monooxygenase [Aeromonas lusitana]PJC94546.1 monooxygenase [Aeromonas lusitana]